MNTYYTTLKALSGKLFKQGFICFMLICINPIFSFGQWDPFGASVTAPIFHNADVGIGTASASNPSSTKLYLKNTLIGAGWNTSNFGQLQNGTYGVYNTDNIWGTLGMHRNNTTGEYFDYGFSCGIDKYGSTFGLMKRPSGGGIMDAYIRWSYNEPDPTLPNDLQFQFNNLALGTSLDAVTFTSTGRVGIGHKAPSEKLLTYSEDITPFKAWQHGNIAYNYCAIFNVENALTKAIVVNQGGWAENFTVMGDGTINPYVPSHVGNDLVVDGRTSIKCAISSSWDLKVNGDAKVTGLFSSSDKNLKYNITKLPTILDKVMLLNSVNYLFKQDIMIGEGDKKVKFNLPKGNQIGFLAQDIEVLFPEMVKDDGEYKAVNYIMLIPVLTQAIQEQQTTIEKQNNEIQLLKNKIDCIQPCNGSIDNTSPKINNDIPKLDQNMPNPFGNSTIIRYSLPEGSQRTYIVVSDLSGKQLKKYTINNTGAGQIEIQAKEFMAGSYLYTLISNDREIDTKKMIIVGE